MSSPNAMPPAGRGTVAAVFADRTRAEDALRTLRERGFRPEEVSVAMRHTRGARDLAQTVAEPGVEEAVRSGSVLVTVRAGERADEAREILRESGGVETREAAGGSAEAATGPSRPVESPVERGEVAASAGSPIEPRSEVEPEQPPIVVNRAPEGIPPVVPGILPTATYYGPLPAGSHPPAVEPEAIQPGWLVRDSDGRLLGTVLEVQPGRIEVDRGGSLGAIYVPLSAVRRVEHDEVTLGVPGNQIDKQGWQRTPPARRVEETEPVSEMRRTAREMMGTAGEVARGVREGQPEEAMHGMFSFMETIPTSTYYFGMIGSILASLWLFISGRRWESLFVGLWAPTLISAGLFYKLLRPSREMR